VLAALDGAGISVRAVTAARPSLDDVYLRHAGRHFAEADQSPSAASSTGGSR
jgi:ABC-2 type transport system ATP-binding protein